MLGNFVRKHDYLFPNVRKKNYFFPNVRKKNMFFKQIYEQNTFSNIFCYPKCSKMKYRFKNLLVSKLGTGNRIP